MALKHIYCCTLIALNCFLLPAQNGTILGKVYNEKSNLLVGANVVIDATKGWIAVTDMNGRYQVDLPPGNYSVTYSAEGKIQQTKTATIEAGLTCRINVFLIPKESATPNIVKNENAHSEPLKQNTKPATVAQPKPLNETKSPPSHTETKTVVTSASTTSPKTQPIASAKAVYTPAETDTKATPPYSETKATTAPTTITPPQPLASVQAVYTPVGIDSNTVTYRRSSLYTLMIDHKNLPKAEVIKKAFLESPIPDKFNDHNLPERVISVDPSPEGIAYYLQRQHIARDLVAKWFNRSPLGGFDMNLVADRGSYNATEMDAGIAQQTKRGLASLADAGEELIGNTFVLVSVFKYTNEADITKHVNTGLSIFSQIMGSAGVNTTAITNSITKLDTNLVRGYIVKASTFLFQLNWNDSIESVFYNDYWTTDANLSTDKKKAFDNSGIFSLKYIGKDDAFSNVQTTSFSRASEEQIIEKAERNALNRVIYKLQKKHEVFRTKTPLYSTEPLSAKIGLKEGLEKGDRYEVLEQVLNKDGRTEYKKVGTIKVDGSQIWDNEYYLTGETPSTGNYIDRTLFTGGNSKIYPGMLIRQK